MDCVNGSASTSPPAPMAAESVVKVVVLLLVLLVIVVSNLLVLPRLCRGGPKPAASDKLIRTLCLIGVLNGLLNIPPYLLITCSGTWILGDALCQFQGLLGSVIIDSWRWILAIAAFERYMKLLVPSEHDSYFSDVNTKILTWGSILLLFVLHMGPVYGWGEYTIFRGKLDLKLTISDNDTAIGSAGLISVMNYLEALFLSDNSVLTSTKKNLTSYFEEERQILMRKPLFGERSMVLPLRAVTRAALQCFCSEFEDGSLVTSLQELMASNSTLKHIGVPNFEVSASIEKDKYDLYSEVHIPYQEGATCSLDYSDANEHVYSFLGIIWVANLAAPLLIMTYCYARLYFTAHRLEELSKDSKGMPVPAAVVTEENVLWTSVCAYTGFSTMLCAVPFCAASLLAGRGVYIPTAVHFSTTVLVFSSPCLLAFFYACSIMDTERWHCSCYGQRDAVTGRREMDILRGMRQRLLSLPVGGQLERSSPDLRTPSTLVSASTSFSMVETAL